MFAPKGFDSLPKKMQNIIKEIKDNLVKDIRNGKTRFNSLTAFDQISDLLEQIQ